MSEDRKKDHIELAFSSAPSHQVMLDHCYYEPLLSAHPTKEILAQKFMGFDFGMPLWISSMTGGTKQAAHINKNLAMACSEFKIGMGLGSCRPLLESNERIADFDIKKYMPNAPLFTNFGIAQLEDLIADNKISKIIDLTKRLEADGIIIHVNPLQEWAQAEGDRFKKSPIDTIKSICDEIDFPLIVKEVGQGMGPKSLEILASLPIAAIELAGFGGTNFTILEQARRTVPSSGRKGPADYLGYVGHTPDQMINWLNNLQANKPEIIISGGIKNPVRAHDLMLAYTGNSITGMASEVLEHALEDYEHLKEYLTQLRESFAICKAYIKR